MNKASLLATGGGPFQQKPLNDVEKRVADLTNLKATIEENAGRSFGNLIDNNLPDRFRERISISPPKITTVSKQNKQYLVNVFHYSRPLPLYCTVWDCDCFASNTAFVWYGNLASAAKPHVAQVTPQNDFDSVVSRDFMCSFLGLPFRNGSRLNGTCDSLRTYNSFTHREVLQVR